MNRRGSFRRARAVLAGIGLACAGVAVGAGAEPADNGAWPEDARGLLQRPDFVRTDSGTNAICLRAVAFCGHVHLHTNTWRYVAAEADHLELGREMLGSALSKYPLAVLSNRLDAVHLLRPGTLSQFRDGQWDPAAAGTYGEKAVYSILEVPSGREGASRFSEAVFHHELSSILVGGHPELFDDDGWWAANPRRFKYANQREGTPQLATNDLPQGFVCSYGKVSLENDVNTYAMHLFTRADWLLGQAERYPRVKRKVNALIRFYGKLDPGFTREFFLERCQTALSAEERDRLDDLGRAIAEDPSDPAGYGTRACLYNNLDLFPEAIEDAETALRIDPEYAYGYFVRGWARVRIDRPEEAIADFTRAIEFKPAMVHAYEERAHAYRKLGRKDDAKRDRQTAAELKAAREEGP